MLAASFARLPRLEQQLPARPSFLREPFLTRENLLATEPSLSDDALERLVLVRRALVPEKHGAGFDLRAY